MADGRKLDSGEVVRLEKGIVERYETIKGLLARLQGTIDMIENQWTGQGAGAFNQKQTEINGHVVALGRMLEKVLDGVNLNRKDKDKLEDELHSRIKQIDVQDLGGKTSALNSY
ncbi:WXG100 family type VII secretion target [Streptomyces sp. NBC_00996]|uniref:WXG100 family type VII secretion target n=1 Tax=Streptomyces sp. NBC_00996 TaxID=2903710 RepID=UPI00386976F7|nr:WXG100 family type VII secretion target [Streptomyces sp. NBC_00996]